MSFEVLKRAIVFSLIVFNVATYGQQLTTQNDENDLPKLPVYAGKGYNILAGNPLHSQKVDPGFTHPLFDFTYNKKVTTQDGKYLIPDQLEHTKVTSCSFSTYISEYRGTESYQHQLQTKAQINGGYKGLMFQASFSSSTSYKKLQNETIAMNQSLTHATAECENYKISVNMFTINNLSPNFINGAVQSYKSKNWTTFYLQFGSHFAYEAIMGGRAVQQISYSSKSVSTLRTLNVDISIIAKASFAKFYMDTSFDWKKYENEVKYSEQMQSSRRQIYIGGQPPQNGNISQWQKNIIDDPMPVSYKLLPISELFKNIKVSGFDASQASTQFLAYLDQFCQHNQCKKPTPDKPLPPPAKVQTSKTDSFGGNGGSTYEWSYPSPTMNVVKVLLRSGNQIQKIQIMIGDGVKSYVSPEYGGNGGNPVSWNVPTNQYISQIEFRSGDRVDSLTFVTNKGEKSPKFGKDGGSYHLLTLPENSRIIGIFGKSSSRLDKLGFIVAKTVYSEESPKQQLIMLQ